LPFLLFKVKSGASLSFCPLSAVSPGAAVEASEVCCDCRLPELLQAEMKRAKLTVTDKSVFDLYIEKFIKL